MPLTARTIPVIADRCHQGRVRSALEPEWEAGFEPKSYGFRPGRGCHDAIQAIYTVCRGLRAKRVWALDAAAMPAGAAVPAAPATAALPLDSVEAVRASMGAVFTQRIAQAEWSEFETWLRTGAEENGGQRVAASRETIEARLFAEDEIPWDDIAFRTVKETLQAMTAASG